MYPARPWILELTGTTTFNDNRFIQYALPDYMAAHPEECVDWDVVFDDRGDLVEPHTRRRVPLGTIQVRTYLGEHLIISPAVELNVGFMFPTTGPENRYRNILYIEKQGFDSLLAAAQIAERFDLAVMSTKGMSVTAARKLIDRLAPKIDRLFKLHDFDISGFSIAGTLTVDSRRYTFENALADKVVDVGLRLVDIEAMGLQSEPVKIEGDFRKRAETLFRHGATHKEIEFLLGRGEKGPRRVELNAMTSPQFVAFLERKLTEHGIKKVIPGPEILEKQARRLLEQRFAEEALDRIRPQLAARAAAYEIPANLQDRVRRMLAERPELSWDMTVAIILKPDRR
jgi:hypothetical protein